MIHLGSFLAGLFVGAFACFGIFALLGLASRLRQVRQEAASARAAAAAAVAGAMPIDDDLRQIQADRVARALERGQWQ